MLRPLSCALLVVLALLAIFVACRLAGRRKDGYLIYPYLDLEEPGERGSYYALAEST